MSARFSYFSHIENLNTGILVLTSPFDAAHQDPLLCRYALHQADVDVLQPDDSFHGMARWHRLLPFRREEIQALDRPLYQFKTLPHDALQGHFLVKPNCELPYLAAIPSFLQSREKKAFAVTPDGAGRCLLQTPVPCHLYLPQSDQQNQIYEGSAQVGKSTARDNHTGAADLGAWGNPFRLEAWKCIGLEIATRHTTEKPTVVVHDPTGELLAGLVLAGQQIQAVRGETPYRLIALTTRPYHQLATLFEGAQPDWEPLLELSNRKVFQPPNPMPGLITQGIADLLGTVLTLNEAPTATLFDNALELLERTCFVDEEDVVYRITAEY